MSPSDGPGLRERKKAATRRTLQEQAMRLFLAQGYDATTVQEIADAAGVSHMTFFRNFPTKEDVVLVDDLDPLAVDLIRARDPGESDFEKIRNALLAGLRSVYATGRDTLFERTRLVLHTPALRARLWQNQTETQNVLVRALGDDGLQRHVLVAACLAAVTSAAVAWVEHSGREDFPALVEAAFEALRTAVPGTEP